MTRVLVPLAEGFEMLEALSVVDVFRRAGTEVDVAAVGDVMTVVSSHRVPVIADCFLADCAGKTYDLIVVPGGIPGANNLQKSVLLANLLKKQRQENRMYGAICAAPALVLEHHGLLEGKKATCHPGFVAGLKSPENAGQSVVADGNCVTGRGAGFSIEFALELVGRLLGSEKRTEVEKGMALVN